MRHWRSGKETSPLPAEVCPSGRGQGLRSSGHSEVLLRLTGEQFITHTCTAALHGEQLPEQPGRRVYIRITRGRVVVGASVGHGEGSERLVHTDTCSQAGTDASGHSPSFLEAPWGDFMSAESLCSLGVSESQPSSSAGGQILRELCSCRMYWVLPEPAAASPPWLHAGW